MIATISNLSQFCLAHRLPEKVVALLSVFNFEVDELNDIIVSYEYENPTSYCTINGIKYLILDETDVKIIVEKSLENYIEAEYRPELPEWAEAYLDWDKFKEDAGFTIEFLIPEAEKIVLHNFPYKDDSVFYYTQINDFSIDCC